MAASASKQADLMVWNDSNMAGDEWSWTIFMAQRADSSWSVGAIQTCEPNGRAFRIRGSYRLRSGRRLKEAIDQLFGNTMLEGKEPDWVRIVAKIKPIDPALAAEVQAELNRKEVAEDAEESADVRLVRLWVSKASWPPSTASGGGGIGRALGNARLHAAVRQFVTAHILRKGRVPVGSHQLAEELDPLGLGVTIKDGFQRHIYRAGAVELDVKFPDHPKVKLHDIEGWPLDWTEATDAVCGKTLTETDADDVVADDDVYLIGSGSATFFVRPSVEPMKSSVAVPSRPVKQRHLYLNSYEGEGMKPKWCWNDLDSDESSQEFESKRSALKAMREDALEWTRAEDLG